MSDFLAEKTISIQVNDHVIDGTVEVRISLADFLRNHVRLTGTHLGCEQGACGACTVLVNGQAVRSCLLFAVQADGAAVITIEGLGSNGRLDRIQEAFRSNHALQCGFCTPGMIVAAYDLLARHPQPSETIVRRELGWQSVPLHRL
nr:(2Fe-2S)-binding protein [uncultured bacterium]